MFRIDVDTSGPIFNGTAQHHVSEFLREVVWEIAKEGRGDLGVRFIKVFKKPTGYYESHVEAVRPTPGPSPVARIHDNGVIYGHWLEGTGSRNYPVTRFKGYASFRTVTQELQRKVAGIAARHLPVFIARMNGGV